MANLNHLESAARRQLSAPENWYAYAYEVIGENHYLVTGEITTAVYTRGPRKGRPKFVGRGTKVVLTREDVEAESRRYALSTGNCPECFGKKEVFQSWSREEGTKTRPCANCEATGVADHLRKPNDHPH